MRLVFLYEKGRGGIYAALTCSSGVEGHYSLQEAKTASPLRPNFVIARNGVTKQSTGPHHYTTWIE